MFTPNPNLSLSPSLFPFGKFPFGILLSYKKKNEIMPFVATCIDLEMIILSEVSQTKINMI